MARHLNEEEHDTWCQVMVTAPDKMMADLLTYLREVHNFYDIDWCVMRREEDYARVDYAPVDPLTSCEYEWLKEIRDWVDEG